MEQKTPDYWGMLDQNLIVDELEELDTRCRWLGIDDLTRPLADKSVDDAMAAMRKIIKAGPPLGCSLREAVVLFGIVKALATTLLELIDVFRKSEGLGR